MLVISCLKQLLLLLGWSNFHSGLENNEREKRKIETVSHWRSICCCLYTGLGMWNGSSETTSSFCLTCQIPLTNIFTSDTFKQLSYIHKGATAKPGFDWRILQYEQRLPTTVVDRECKPGRLHVGCCCKVTVLHLS